MSKEQYANGSVVYTSKQLGESKTCIDSLGDDAHYRFACRCGCGGEFAGYGKDIKAAAKVGRAFNPIPVDTKTTSPATTVTVVDAPPRRLIATTSVEGTEGIAADFGIVLKSKNKPKALKKETRYVSDRYLKKALYGLTDDEINAYHDENPDPLEAQGVNLSDRQPPKIGDLVYSLATGEGPYSLLEYQQHEVGLEGGSKTKLLCGLCRTKTGDFEAIPLADLAVNWDERPITEKPSVLVPLVMAVISAAIGSALVVGSYWYF